METELIASSMLSYLIPGNVCCLLTGGRGLKTLPPVNKPSHLRLLHALRHKTDNGD